MKIELEDLFCYDYNNYSDYGDYITEEIEVANEDNRYFWEAFNNNNCGHQLKWIIKKDKWLEDKIEREEI